MTAEAGMFMLRCLAILALVAGLSGPALAQDRPVVVELFTSQGCSACPPADKLFEKLTDHEGVIPLALHVDYWDYIGWKDHFAKPAYTARQKAYARAGGRRSVYTPQMIIGGEDHIIGTHPMDLADLVRAHSERESPVSVSMTREGDSLRIMVASETDVGDCLVQVVRYTPSETVTIKRGENAGQTLHYANIVTEWRVVDAWAGKGTARFETEVTGGAPVVVIVQRQDHGPILGAARLR